MQSPILQGTLVICPVVGMPSAEGRTAEPQTSDTMKSTPERAGILFTDLVPDDISLVLPVAVVPVWPPVISPVPFGIAPTETIAVKDSDIEAGQPILCDAAAGSGLSDYVFFTLIAAPPIDPVGQAAKTGPIEDFDNGNVKPVSTDDGASGAPTAPMPSAAMAPAPAATTQLALVGEAQSAGTVLRPTRPPGGGAPKALRGWAITASPVLWQ